MNNHFSHDCGEDYLSVDIETPAMVAGVVKNGIIIFSAAKGYLQHNDKFIPASTDDTIFSVASISKIMLAVVCLQCVEKEIFQLDDNINDKLPQSCQVYHSRFPLISITPRMLLQHRSGLRDNESALERGSKWRVENEDFGQSLGSYVHETITSKDLVWSAARPGDASYHYSNLGFTILAYYIEVCTSTSLHQLAREGIFNILGMNHSSYSLTEIRESFPANNINCHIAIPHSRDGWTSGLYGVAEWPAAGLRCSLMDLLLFLQDITNPVERSKLLSDASLAEMLPENFYNGLAWWGRDAMYGEQADMQVWSHGGFMDGIRSHLHYWPKHNAGIVLIQNGEGAYTHVIEKLKEKYIPEVLRYSHS